MNLNIIGILLLTYILLWTTIVLRYPFWSKQPVFHFWNIRQWIHPSGIIRETPISLNNRFYDKSIIYNNIDDLDETTITQFCKLVNKHFMRSIEVDYTPSKESILAHLTRNYNKSSIAYKYVGEKMIGAITGRQMNCYFNDVEKFTKTNKLETHKLPLTYVDYLCVAEGYRKKNIAPNLIYTFYANQQKYTQVCLFKREGESHFIVPLCVYMTYGFSLDKLFSLMEYKQIKYLLPPLTNILEINDVKQISLFLEYEHTIKSIFKCVVLPSRENIIEMITKNVLYMYSIVSKNNELLALYIFKNTQTKFDGKKSLDCIATFNNTDENTFINGFLTVLTTKLSTEILLIENISNNKILLETLTEITSPIFNSKTSYYFYNYSCHPFYPREVFILN